MLINLMPVSWRPYAKAVVSVVAALVAVAPQVIDALPEEWKAPASAAVGLIGSYLVYVTPNQGGAPVPSGEEAGE